MEGKLIDKKIVIFAIFLFLANCGYSIVGPFYPPVAFSRGGTNFLVGLVVASNALANFIASFLFGKILNKCGKKRILLVGALIYAISTASFGLLCYIENEILFFVFSFLIRIMQGAGTGGIMLSIFSLIPFLYPESMEKIFQISEASSGFGYIFGPIIGTYLYQL